MPLAVLWTPLPAPGTKFFAATAGDPEDDEIADDNPLTTKEGWRRFVDTEPSPPSMLDDTALAGLGAADRTAYDEARIDYHAGLPLVNTPVIRQVISTSRLLIQLNRHQVSARRGVVISGASGTGKTTALSQLGRAHELAGRKRHPDDPAGCRSSTSRSPRRRRRGWSRWSSPGSSGCPRHGWRTSPT